MISRDLTCNETMPPLDDGDTKTDMHRTRNGKAMTGRASSGTALPKPSTEFGPSGSLNRMTTVRDVVTRHFRNSKLNASADPSLVGLGDFLSTMISHNSQNQHQRHVLITSHADCNGFTPTIDRHHKSMAPTAHSSAEDGWRNAHLSPSSTSSSISTPPSCALIAAGNLTQLANMDINISDNSAQHLCVASSSTSIPSSATPSSSFCSSLLHPLKSDSGISTNYYVNTVPMEESVAATSFISPPLAVTGTVIEQKPQQHIFHQQPPQWAICPPIENSVQLQQRHMKSGGTVPNRMSTVVQMASPKPLSKIGETRSHKKTQQHQSETHRIIASTAVPSVTIVYQQQSPSASISAQKQQHTSPRPGILRGNASAVRRLTVDRDRPASVSGSFTNDAEESPRKRLRKQHFDNSHITGDKVMVEVRPNDRIAQSASAGPSLTMRCWRSPNSSTTTEGARGTQQRPFVTDPLARIGAVIVSKNAVEGMPTEGKQEPKKRGRPKMNCRTQQLPLMSANTTANRTENVQRKQKTHQQVELGAGESGKQQKHDEKLQKHKLEHGNHLTTTHAGSAKTTKPKAIIVKVEHITETVQKKRKYQKRTLDIDPLTGARKVRKKGSGRKSKKELAALAMSARRPTEMTSAERSFGLDSQCVPTVLPPPVKCNNASCTPKQHEVTTSYNDGKQLTAMEVPDLMPKTAAERDVINTLCRFKSDKDNREMMACRTTLNSTPLTLKSPPKCAVIPSKPDDVVESIQKPSCSYSTLETECFRPLPLLTDLNKLSILRPMLRRCERGLNSTDNCHLSESYEEICNFLRSTNRRTVPDNDYSAGSSKHSFISSHLPPANHLDERCVDRLSANVSCSIFDNYDEFKNASNSLRLLPVACAYFDASHRLLSSLRTSLRAISLYHALQEIKLEEDSDRWFFGDGNAARTLVGIEAAETEEDDDAEGEREERLTRALFTQLDTDYEKYVGRHWQDGEEKWQNNGDLQLKVTRQLLLQLDVAQTLDLVLHNVAHGRNSIQNNQTHSIQSRRECCEITFKFSDINLSGNSPSSCGYDLLIDRRKLPDDLGKIMWTKRKIGATLGRGKKRKADDWDNEKEEREHDEREERKKQRHARTPQKSSSHLLKSIGRFSAESSAESAILDRIAFLLEQRMANSHTGAYPFTTKASSSDSILKCRTPSDSTTTKRKRNNNTSKTSHQFFFCPSNQMVGDLFKFVPKLPYCGTAAMENKGERIGVKEMQQKVIAAVVNQKQQPKLLKADVEEMMTNCQWGSAKALTELRHKHSEILNEPSSSSRDQIGDELVDCTSGPFGRTLYLHFPSSSAPKDEQSESFELRLKGLHEICNTALALSRSRAALAEQCAEALYEMTKEMGQEPRMTKEQSSAVRAKLTLKRMASANEILTNSHRPATYFPSLTKLCAMREHQTAKTTSMTKIISKQPHHRQRRKLSMEKEDEQSMPTETSGRETPIEPQQGRQSPVKRAAHQRARTQMIISTVSE